MSEKLHYFGENMYRIRRERGMSQEELALNIGVGKSSISKYERGLQDPSLDIAYATADFFQVDLQQLIRKYKRSDYIADAETVKELIGEDAGYIKAVKLAIANEIPPKELEKIIKFAIQMKDE